MPSYDSGSMYDEDSAPSTAEDSSNSRDEKSDETEDQLALVPTSFFKNPPKPGAREEVEIVHVYENEVSIKCVYGEKKEKESEEPKEHERGEMSEEEDSMMM